jgi:membrane associated rhomboid family serine protease
VVLSIIILCVMMFSVEAGSSHPTELDTEALGLVPKRALAGALLPWFSHMFLHGGAVAPDRQPVLSVGLR